MKSFLVKNKTKESKACPIVPWGMLQDNTFYEGEIPEGYSLAISPNSPYIIVDVDRHEGGKDGFKEVSGKIYEELINTFNYPTKNNGGHFWFKYTGNKVLLNKASGLGIDLRIGANKETGNSGGYVIFYPAMDGKGDIRDHIHKIKETSKELNKWIEELFT